MFGSLRYRVSKALKPSWLTCPFLPPSEVTHTPVPYDVLRRVCLEAHAISASHVLAAIQATCKMGYEASTDLLYSSVQLVTKDMGAIFDMGGRVVWDLIGRRAMTTSQRQKIIVNYLNPKAATEITLIDGSFFSSDAVATALRRFANLRYTENLIIKDLHKLHWVLLRDLVKVFPNRSTAWKTDPLFPKLSEITIRPAVMAFLLDNAEHYKWKKHGLALASVFRQARNIKSIRLEYPPAPPTYNKHAEHCRVTVVKDLLGYIAGFGALETVSVLNIGSQPLPSCAGHAVKFIYHFTHENMYPALWQDRQNQMSKPVRDMIRRENQLNNAITYIGSGSWWTEFIQPQPVPSGWGVPSIVNARSQVELQLRTELHASYRQLGIEERRNIQRMVKLTTGR